MSVSDSQLSAITQTRMGSVIFQEMTGVRGGHPILFFFNLLKKRLRILGSVAHYHPKCQSGTSTPHLDSVCVPVGKICIIRIVFQSLKVIAKGFYMGEHLSSNWNRQSIYLLHVKYLQKCSLLCKHNFSVDPQFFSPINT